MECEKTCICIYSFLGNHFPYAWKKFTTVRKQLQSPSDRSLSPSAHEDEKV
jgi:hypothetical protein